MTHHQTWRQDQTHGARAAHCRTLVLYNATAARPRRPAATPAPSCAGLVMAGAAASEELADAAADSEDDRVLVVYTDSEV